MGNEREQLIKLINETDADVFVECFASTTFLGHSLRSFKRKAINDDNPYFISAIKEIRDSEDTEPNLKKELLDCVYFDSDYMDVINIYDDKNAIFFFAPAYMDEELIQIIKMTVGKAVVFDIQCDWLDRRFHGWNVKYLDNRMAIYYNF